MNIEDLDRSIEMMVARLELDGVCCGLKHSKEDPAENHPAVDYLCQRLGDQKTGEATQELRIPICAECSNALYDEKWILAYCTFCHASQWIYRPKAKTTHPEGNGVYWLDVCPHCAEIANEYKEGEDDGN
jgi:hypothetical protein